MQAPLLQAALRRPTAQLLSRTVSKAPAATRTFSHLPNLRPSLSAPRPIFRQPTTCLITTPFTPTATTAASTAEAGVLDLVPKTSISSHPALAGAGSQIRCGPRPTMRGASRLVQKRRHGFLSRVKTQNGRKTIARRRAKGRKKLGH